MKPISLRVASVAGAAMLIAASVAAQGIYTESTMSGGPMGSGSHASKSYLMPKMFKSESGTGEIIIVRADKEELYGINPAEKTYWAVSFAEMEAGMKKARGNMDQKMAELQEQMKDMPEAQRKQMEGMMSMMGGKGAKVEIAAAGEKKEICGYSCTKNVVKSNGKEVMTLWVAKGVKGFEPLRKDWMELSKRMMAVNPGNNQEMMEAFSRLDGYPLQTDVMGMTSVVTKIENRSTPASAFEIPAGYKKVDSPMKKGLE